MFVALTNNRQPQNQQQQGACHITMYHFRPGFIQVNRHIRVGLVRPSDLIGRIRPQQVAIATWPVWTAKACIYQPSKGPQDYNDYTKQNTT